MIIYRFSTNDCILEFLTFYFFIFVLIVFLKALFLVFRAYFKSAPQLFYIITSL